MTVLTLLFLIFATSDHIFNGADLCAWILVGICVRGWVRRIERTDT